MGCEQAPPRVGRATINQAIHSGAFDSQPFEEIPSESEASGGHGNVLRDPPLKGTLAENSDMIWAVDDDSRPATFKLDIP